MGVKKGTTTTTHEAAALRWMKEGYAEPTNEDDKKRLQAQIDAKAETATEGSTEETKTTEEVVEGSDDEKKNLGSDES